MLLKIEHRWQVLIPYGRIRSLIGGDSPIMGRSTASHKPPLERLRELIARQPGIGRSPSSLKDRHATRQSR